MSEPIVDVALIRRLVAGQFPQWADLAIRPVPSAGTDHLLFRLGEHLAVRLPRLQRAAGQVAKEQRWLPVLAPHLPLAVPTPCGLGQPAGGYPWQWSVYRWIDGQDANVAPPADLDQAATGLADFVAALQRIDPAGGPSSGPHNEHRGVPLIDRDRLTRGAIADLRDTLDAGAATRLWEASLAAPAWAGAPVWLHGDIQAGNLLTTAGQLAAVIDFGALGVGDPACDLMIAWTLLPPGARDLFQRRLEVDDATWVRGRGWALSVGVIALAFYRSTNPVLSAVARRGIEAALAHGFS